MSNHNHFQKSYMSDLSKEDAPRWLKRLPLLLIVVLILLWAVPDREKDPEILKTRAVQADTVLVDLVYLSENDMKLLDLTADAVVMGIRPPRLFYDMAEEIRKRHKAYLREIPRGKGLKDYRTAVRAVIEINKGFADLDVKYGEDAAGTYLEEYVVRYQERRDLKAADMENLFHQRRVFLEGRGLTPEEIDAWLTESVSEKKREAAKVQARAVDDEFMELFLLSYEDLETAEEFMMGVAIDTYTLDEMHENLKELSSRQLDYLAAIPRVRGTAFYGRALGEFIHNNKNMMDALIYYLEDGEEEWKLIYDEALDLKEDCVDVFFYERELYLESQGFTEEEIDEFLPASRVYRENIQEVYLGESI